MKKERGETPIPIIVMTNEKKEKEKIKKRMEK